MKKLITMCLIMVCLSFVIGCAKKESSKEINWFNVAGKPVSVELIAYHSWGGISFVLQREQGYILCTTKSFRCNLGYLDCVVLIQSIINTKSDETIDVSGTEVILYGKRCLDVSKVVVLGHTFDF